MQQQDSEIIAAESEPIREVLAFSQFRLKLIEFFKLPLNVSEPALREVLKNSSRRVFENYLVRAMHARVNAAGLASSGAENTLR
jgi:hypothetical protein